MKHVPYTTGTDKKIILSAMGAKKNEEHENLSLILGYDVP